MMVSLLQGYSVVVVSIQMGMMVVLVTFDWLTVLCGVMCEKWFIIGWVHLL